MRRTLLRISVFILLFYSCSNKENPKNINYRIEGGAKELTEVLAALEQMPDNLTLNIKVWGYFTEKGRVGDVIKYAVPVFERTDMDTDMQLKLYAGAYIAQAYMLQSKYDSVNYYLGSISPYIENGMGDKFLRVMVYNINGTMALRSEMDYSKALDNFRLACGLIRERKDTSNLIILLGNIASIYATRLDTSGMKYAMEAYALSKQIDNPYARINSTLQLSQMYLLSKDYNKAVQLTDEASSLAIRYPQFMTNVYHNYAEISRATGDYVAAEKYFSNAIAFSDSSEPQDIISLYLDYGTMQYQRYKYDEATELFSKGIVLSKKQDNIQYMHSLILAKSDAEYALGHESVALQLYKDYHRLTDSIFNVQKEMAFQRLVVENEKAELNSRIQDAEVKLERTRKRYNNIFLGFIILLMALFGLYYTNRKRTLYYRKLVENHQRYMNMTATLRYNIEESKENTLAEERLQSDSELWKKIEKMVCEDKMYREKDISLDKIAELTGTNRVYVSRAINRYSGMSFYSYINNLRIEEAIKMLKDNPADTPMKTIADALGYNSLPAFYRVFQKETGCPPSRYRAELKNMRATKKAQ